MKKTTKKAAKKTAAKKAVKTVKKVAKRAAKKAVSKKTGVKKIAAKVAPSKTTIIANIDVGFGNALFVRGDGPGLSWSKGIPMDCAADTTWSLSMSGVRSAFEYKVLINDQYWSAGENEIARPGNLNSVNPRF